MSDFRLKVFHSVAKLGSFSKAGNALYISQPAVSSQIKFLEEEFGTRLFLRTPKRAVLTPAGQILFDYTTKILALYKEAENKIMQYSDTVKGKLTIGATSTTASYYLPLIIAEFKQKYPDVEIITFVSNTQNVVKSMKEGVVDFCIVSEPIHEHHYLPRTVIEDELGLIVSPNHKWASKKSVTLEQLMAEPLVLRERGSGTRETLRVYLKEKGKKFEELNVIMTLGTTSSVKVAVQSGVGVAFVVKTAIKLDLKAGFLKMLTIKDMPMIQTFTALFPIEFRKNVTEEFFRFIQEFDLS